MKRNASEAMSITGGADGRRFRTQVAGFVFLLATAGNVGSAQAAPIGDPGAVTTFAAMTGDVEHLIVLGGPVVVLLLAASVLGLAVVMFKWWQLAEVRDSRLDRIATGIDLWCRGRHADGITVLRNSRIGYAGDIEFALNHLTHVDRELLRDELGRRARNFAERFAGLMRPLELLYYLAPLLGLLGTVLGMIEAFRELQAAAGDAAHAGLAGGIWEALLTTAVGLAVAIPFALLHAHLHARLERLHARLDDFALRVLNLPLSAAVGSDAGD